VCRRHASHITVVLSKAAHSGPSVCLRARAPCPLRVSCPGTDRAERAVQAAGVSVQPSCRRERAVQTAGSCASVPPLVKTRTMTRAANELSPPKSACASDAVLRTSTRGTVHMGRCAGLQHVAVAASETREVSAGATAGNGQSAVARPDAPMSAQIKREVSVRQRSLIR
jgi:hypothetical protein